MIYNCLRCGKEFESSVLVRKYCSKRCASIENKKAHSAGGVARGIIQRADALKKYNENPNVCKQCSATIVVKDGQKVQDTRRKKFCSQSCSAIFNNLLRGVSSRKKKPIKSLEALCKGCSKNLVKNRRHTCVDCKGMSIGPRTKGDVFSSCLNWQSARSWIRRHACLVWKNSGKVLECSVCKYSLHVEIAHTKAVSDFSNDTLIQEINSIDNLVALCPNHHWEFDNLQRGGAAR